MQWPQGIRVSGLIVVALLAAMLQGCASLYLHSPEAETATQAAKDDLDKIKVDQYFTDARSRLQAFATDEDKTVAAYLVAARNQEIAGLVRMDVLQTAGSARDSLKKRVLARAELILGQHPAAKPLAERLMDTGLRDLPRLLDIGRESIEINRGAYIGALRDFGRLSSDGDARQTDCDKVPTGELPETTPDQVAYVRLVEACKAVQTANSNLAKDKAILDPAAGSQLQVVARKLRDATAVIDAQTVEAARLTTAIKKLQAEPPSSVKDLEARIQQIRDLLKKAQGVAGAAGAEEISKVLEDILAADLAAAPQPGAKPAPKLTQGTLAVLKLTKALAQANDAFSADPQVVRVNSILLAIAEQRQRLDMAKLSIDEQREKVQVYRAQEDALIREVGLLSVTHRVIAGTLKDQEMRNGFASLPSGESPARRGAGAALAAYVDSWNQGQIPYWLLDFREVQIERAYWVERAAKTAKNWNAVLSPPLDDLVAYGKGGIHPETIAMIITNLGLIGAVLAR